MADNEKQRDELVKEFDRKRELGLLDADCKCPDGPCYHDQLFPGKEKQ